MVWMQNSYAILTKCNTIRIYMHCVCFKKRMHLSMKLKAMTTIGNTFENVLTSIGVPSKNSM